ncbi:MAG TPA: thioredoxin domain-containing protein [Vicinamibacterales bacterium]|nr:thioredoxin domain-containing protein [Vicinamibacterales bacterium]
MPNRLAAEKSPYLLQHKDNPVNWYPWGEEAFEAARREDKPIFLSIGYSTCHWCHVMERESFENPEIAAVLNQEFIPVKVDREERPDIDRVYMTFVQATTGSGGWPMSVWLTPQLEPFFGGTYFPPTSRWQRPGFLDVLREIARLWKTDRLRIVQSAASLADQLRALAKAGAGAGDEVPGPEVLEASRAHFASTYDARRGGFGNAPKFPRPSELLFLFREHARTGAADARDMALQTLRAMALGGMRDHVGGGFHRYSVDAEWRVPHFEKMLYDQAQLTLAYLEAAQITGDRFFADVAEDTLAYVQREMTDEGGGFHSAEDADSIPPEERDTPGAHKREGAFYLWRADEIDALLGDDAPVFRLRYGIEPNGNAPEDPQGEFVGRNILHVARDIDTVARETGRSTEDVWEALSRARLTLFSARLARPRPHLDDKVLTAWNGLMIAAFARGARVLRASALGGSPETAAELLAAARRAAAFLRRTMWDEGRKRLLRRYRDGEAAIAGYAEDYACLVFGLLELFQADGDIAWLEWALALQERQDELFGDPGGGWFSTTGDDPSVLIRLKEDYDGAEPAASSLGAANLLTLAHLTGAPDLAEQARRTLASFGPRLARFGPAAPFMLSVLSAWHAGMSQVVIAGADEDENTGKLLDVLATTYRPFTVVLRVRPEPDERWRRLLPLAAAMKPIGGRAAAYVCRDFTCRQPVTEAERLRDELER